MEAIETFSHEDFGIVATRLQEIIDGAATTRKRKTYGILFQVNDWVEEEGERGYTLSGCIMNEEEHRRFREFMKTLPRKIGTGDSR